MKPVGIEDDFLWSNGFMVQIGTVTLSVAAHLHGRFYARAALCIMKFTPTPSHTSETYIWAISSGV
jgi:translation initiation factor 2B subunit (eIF-2B alpha/beta/delta family)